MPNRLASQSSPYLLQHAHNPVDWHPWDDEALALARSRDIPIFLSIGYATCYWCHVMERESFEDPAIAERLARDYVSIKLDREQRPDLDELYMAACVITTGHGGWPLNAFLDPHTLAPFYCGTYFPPAPRPDLGRPSFAQVLEGLAHAWRTDRDHVRLQAGAIADAVREQMHARATPVRLGPQTIADAVALLLASFDARDGGFGQGPKFPQIVYLDLLLSARDAVDADTRPALDRAVTLTLDAMGERGLHDHLAGGFHRYCVDTAWAVPHFEKMLYDQAQLALVYAHASRVYAQPRFAAIARRTLDFVLRDLRGGDALFFSAIDAEVESREGLNYLWTPDQFHAALGDDAPDAIALYGLDSPPNFRDPHHPADPPSWVLRFDRAHADHLGEARVTSLSEHLLAARNTRPQPRTDDKAIVSWNAMMIHALARAGALLEEPRFIAAARETLHALLLLHNPRALTRISRHGVASIDAQLEDYAWLARSLFALADLTNDPVLREQGDSLLDAAIAQFVEDDVAYDAQASAHLFARPRSIHDGANPSSTSVLLHALIDAANSTGNQSRYALAQRILGAMSDRLAAAPASSTHAIEAILRLLRLGQAGPLAAAQLPEAAPVPPRATSHQALQVFATDDRLTITPGHPAQTTLLVRIAKGYHVLAAEVDDPAAVPFRVGLINGQGLAVYADYPAGELRTVGELRTHVYEGEFELMVALERTGPVTGRPLLAITFQACREGECLPPATLELDLALDAD